MTTQEILEAARSAKSALALADNTARNAALLGIDVYKRQVTASSNASYYKMTIKPDATYVVSRSGDKVDLSNGMSVTARVEYDQVTYFEYAMEALGVLFR